MEDPGHALTYAVEHVRSLFMDIVERELGLEKAPAHLVDVLREGGRLCQVGA